MHPFQKNTGNSQTTFPGIPILFSLTYLPLIMALYSPYCLSQSISFIVLMIGMRKLMLMKISPQYPLPDTPDYEDTIKNSRYQSLQTGITISVSSSERNLSTLMWKSSFSRGLAILSIISDV